MRIGFVQDFTFAERPGGAARAADLWLASAPADLEVVPCKPGNVDRTCDGYVLVLTKFYGDEEYAFLEQSNFMRMELDYWPDGEPSAQWRDRLNDKAKKILFVSPLHRDVYAYRCRYEQDDEWERFTAVLPPPMDPELYAPIRARYGPEDRTLDAIWFGEWHWHKGPDIAMKWAQEQKRVLDMYSPYMPPGSKPPHEWVRLNGYFPEQNGWLDTIARHRSFVHFPRQPECFPYSVLEAYLCGCEVIVSGRLGVESFGLPLDDVVQLCAESRTKLWDIAREVLG